MAQVLAAFEAREGAKDEAKAAARRILDRADARLGREIFHERQSGMRQGAIAARLGHSREQVRRWEMTYHTWDRDHPNDPLD